MKDVTIKDIAKEAGVSTATVSYVINSKKFVSEELKERVNSVILKYNYRRNVIASSLRGKVTKMIGVIVPDSSNPIFSIINREIGILGREKKYNIVVCDSEFDFKKEIEYIQVLYTRNIDGLIFFPSNENLADFKILNDLRIPTVLIERKIEGLNSDIVLIDNYKALIEVVDYLASLGHKRIGYIIKESHLYHSKIKLEGFIEGLKRNNLKYDSSLIMNENNNGYTFEDGYRDMQKFLVMKNKPTAIIAYNDILAIGAMRAIKDKNLKIPDDFSIIGFDDDLIDNYLDTKLTSVTLAKKRIAKRAFALLLDRIENGYDIKSKEILIPRTIKIRESTGKARV